MTVILPTNSTISKLLKSIVSTSMKSETSMTLEHKYLTIKKFSSQISNFLPISHTNRHLASSQKLDLVCQSPFSKSSLGKSTISLLEKTMILTTRQGKLSRILSWICLPYLLLARRMSPYSFRLHSRYPSLLEPQRASS